jgi:hypothetical protein
VPTFADTWRHVVSVTDPYVRNLGFLDRDEVNDFNLPNPSGRIGPYQACNRNEYQKKKKNVSGE